MRLHDLLALSALLVVAGCGDAPAPTGEAPAPPPDHAAEMVFRVDGPVASLDGILAIVDARLAGLGAGRAEAVPGTPPRIRCLLDAPWHTEPGAVEAVVTRRGTLELRVVATEAVMQAEREAREQEGDAYRPSEPTYRWVPSAQAGEDDVLVLIPEQRLVVQIRQAIAQEGPQAREVMDGLRAELDGVRAAEVFGEQDIAHAALQSSGGRNTVFFELDAGRQAAFADFTARHGGRRLAIIVDGAAVSLPTIRTPLPGRGVIDGGGPGLTEREAVDLAAVLTARRALPATLVRESFETVR